MCIIVAKLRGSLLPSEEILRNCFNNNNDGCGFMYEDKHRVVINKGYMDFKKFYKDLVNVYNSKNLKDKNLVMHFRIGTSGTMDASTTHPFPISKNNKDLQNLRLKTDIGMVHNGIISEYAYNKSKLSDTQHFIKEFVYPLYELNKHFLDNKLVINMLYKECNSKLIFLDSNDNLYRIGEFEEKDGVLYSNSSYQTKSWVYDYNKYWSDYSSYNYGYDYDDDYYDIDKFHKDDVIFLDKDMYYCGDLTPNLEECDEYMFLTNDLNLYYYTKTKGDYVYGELIDTHCEIYTKNEKQQIVRYFGGISTPSNPH
jgi:predicted glutamine amidotransferase